MRRVVISSALVALATSLGGCAPVINGTSQPVEFQSDPVGARVELVNGLSCQTPCQYSMQRGSDSRATFTREGYQPVSIYIQSRTGGGVDASNGASNHLYPDPVFVRMVPVGSTAKAALLDKNGAVIATVDEYNATVAADVTEGLQEQGHFPIVAATM